MSSLDWVPELAAALDQLVPLGDSTDADWNDVVGRVGSRRGLQTERRRPRRSLRLAIVVALIFLLLTGAATATYLLLRSNGSIVLGGGPSLPVVNPHGPGLHAIARCPAQRFPKRLSCTISEPVWSPDGTRVAFLRGINGGPQDRSHMSLYVARSDGRGLKRLARCGGCGAPAWSPGGKRIAFSRDNGNTPTVLWVVGSAGGKPRQLTHCLGMCSDTQPVWSPTGNLLAFQRSVASPEASGVYTIRSDGSGLTRIAGGAARGDPPRDPAWSPDGSKIAFDTRDGIEVTNANGSGAHLLVAGAGSDGPGNPSWSPDGQKLVFVRTPGQGGSFKFEVWTVYASGSGQQRLYRSGCCVQFWAPPIWSPDGRMIAFSANSAGGTFVMNADGSALHRLSADAALWLSWQGTPQH